MTFKCILSILRKQSGCPRSKSKNDFEKKRQIGCGSPGLLGSCCTRLSSNNFQCACARGGGRLSHAFPTANSERRRALDCICWMWRHNRMKEARKEQILCFLFCFFCTHTLQGRKTNKKGWLWHFRKMFMMMKLKSQMQKSQVSPNKKENKFGLKSIACTDNSGMQQVVFLIKNREKNR